ncbi:MAG: putative GTPase [Ignavibacteria bacterium]|nr:putative GTPase [Ignavibacteria bacterium]
MKKQNKITKEFIERIKSGDRAALAQAITLLESNAPNHSDLGSELIRNISPPPEHSIRIGITGLPGAGKSTFIDSFGVFLCDRAHRVAVLAVDPSSPVSKGSILGDKTRMEKLSKNSMAFIRPSPSGTNTGGVTKKTRESILLCEAAGFDRIIIETIGVGQSETAVQSMVDFFLLILLPGAGDELQGIKKGSVELADAIIINKADADSERLAKITQNQYQNAIHLIHPSEKDWSVPVLTCSATEGKGIHEVNDIINKFIEQVKASGKFEENRRKQLLDWMYSMIEDNLKREFYQNKEIISQIPKLENEILLGHITPEAAAAELLKRFLQSSIVKS